MSIFLRPVVIVAIALLLLPACATVEIRLVGCSVVAEQPESNAVHYEYRDGVVARKDGEFIVIWIAANGNLEDRARSVTHHLFFKVGLFDSGDGYEDLAGGLVLRAEGAELAVMGDNLRDREGLYKCYFRTDVKFLDIER
ncbi:MAG: hypothetical protein P1V35_02710 [Planctomycetota bacterium]|nr:hypothetical protein [Planctomycetota bacterium]